ncbi:MAG: MFS transporter [Bacteroidia bacterium]|nr:MFS transporter [Bacteroidia bacterium]MDW8333534.1 MFS transporter [Bacteroidia bacterium]
MSRRASRLWLWQTLIVVTLFVGYTGYYFCRSNLAAAAPLLLQSGLDMEDIGTMASLGLLAYTAGKMIFGPFTDFVGGRRMFLLGMGLSALTTAAFGVSAGVTLLTTVWIFNRGAQSIGWGALVKIAAHWFSYLQIGKVMAVLSLSFLFGDSIARYAMGLLMEYGYGWRAMFFIGAAALSFLAIVCGLLLRESPESVGLPAIEVHPDNLYGEAGASKRPLGLWTLVAPFFRSATFWLVAFLSFGLTLSRETFNQWSATYLSQMAHLSAAAASKYSALFPLAGGLSALAAGFFSDRIFGGRRARIIAATQFALFFVLMVQAYWGSRAPVGVSLALMALAALLLIGPYTFLAGAIAIDLGAKLGSSTASGLIDGAGYLGAVVSGWGVAKIAQFYRWDGVFYFLALVALGCSLIAYFFDRRSRIPASFAVSQSPS